MLLIILFINIIHYYLLLLHFIVSVLVNICEYVINTIITNNQYHASFSNCVSVTLVIYEYELLLLLLYIINIT